jgi:hypothetical protein
MFFVAVMTLSLAACDGGGPPLTRAQFSQQVSERECSSVAPACLVGEDDCVTARQTLWTSFARDEETAGRPFDEANAGPCLAKVKAVYGVLAKNLAIRAKDYRNLGDSCGRVFHGGASANEPCTIDADCTGDLICDKGRCGSLRQVTPGGGCANIGEYCVQGYVCEDSSGVWTCVARRGKGAACSADSTCLESLRCADGVCTDGLAIGAPCLADTDCASAFCEPFALRCGNDVRFAPETPACLAFQPGAPAQNPSALDVAGH